MARKKGKPGVGQESFLEAAEREAAEELDAPAAVPAAKPAASKMHYRVTGEDGMVRLEAEPVRLEASSREHMLRVRLSPEEHARLSGRAYLAGVSLSEFVRNTTLRDDDSEITARLRHLQRALETVDTKTARVAYKLIMMVEDLERTARGLIEQVEALVGKPDESKRG